MNPDFQQFPFNWEEVPEIEEVSAGNLRATAMSAPLPGFIEYWTYFGNTCNRGNTSQIAVLPLNKCVPDVMKFTRSPYAVATLTEEGGVKKITAKGYSKSNCGSKPAKAMVSTVPFSMCFGFAGMSTTIVHKKYRTNYPAASTVRAYTNNKCTGSYVDRLTSNLCFPMGDTGASVKQDCGAGGGYMSYATGDCTGPATLLSPLNSLTGATPCSANYDDKRVFEKMGCTSRGPVAMAASSQFAAAEAVESD